MLKATAAVGNFSPWCVSTWHISTSPQSISPQSPWTEEASWWDSSPVAYALTITMTWITENCMNINMYSMHTYEDTRRQIQTVWGIGQAPDWRHWCTVLLFISIVLLFWKDLFSLLYFHFLNGGCSSQPWNWTAVCPSSFILFCFVSISFSHFNWVFFCSSLCLQMLFNYIYLLSVYLKRLDTNKLALPQLTVMMHRRGRCT